MSVAMKLLPINEKPVGSTAVASFCTWIDAEVWYTGSAVRLYTTAAATPRVSPRSMIHQLRRAKPQIDRRSNPRSSSW